MILVVSNSRLHENYFSLGNRETANLGVTRITFLYERKSQLFFVFYPLRHPSLAHHLLFSTGNPPVTPGNPPVTPVTPPSLYHIL